MLAGMISQIFLGLATGFAPTYELHLFFRCAVAASCSLQCIGIMIRECSQFFVDFLNFFLSNSFRHYHERKTSCHRHLPFRAVLVDWCYSASFNEYLVEKLVAGLCCHNSSNLISHPSLLLDPRFAEMVA